MEYILLTKHLPVDQNASLKAPEDIQNIFRKHFGCTYQLYKSEKEIVDNLEEVSNIFKLKLKKGKSNTILFVQWPLYPKKPFSEEIVFKLGYHKVAAIIHDIDFLRFYPDDKERLKYDIGILNRFDVVICHNIFMLDWLRRHGMYSEAVTLDVFDYLVKNPVNYEHSDQYRIVFAGNLDKSLFVKQLSNVVCHPVNLYGNITKYKLDNNLNYFGSFPVFQIDKELRGEFGLIWDGNVCNTCAGNNGNYMKYNNPHKLSLYLACGLPVITWKEAAVAKFIEEYHIGFTVNSLDEIDSVLDFLDYKDYLKILENVCHVRKDIIKGNNTIKAINKAVQIIGI